jgi:hypothetical protein
MEKDNYKTDVIFRVWNNKNFCGDHILALFPHEVCEYNGNVTSYEHVGQHGGANYNHCINVSKHAKETEYKDLFEELESIGYDLNIVKRQNYDKYLKSYHEINKSK